MTALFNYIALRPLLAWLMLISILWYVLTFLLLIFVLFLHSMKIDHLKNNHAGDIIRLNKFKREIRGMVSKVKLK